MNVNWKPNQVVDELADEPALRPNAKSSATPPTTGGSTIGSTTARARARGRGSGARASTHASGTPKSTREERSPRASTRSTAASRQCAAGLLQVVPRGCSTGPAGAARPAGARRTRPRRAASEHREQRHVAALGASLGGRRRQEPEALQRRLARRRRPRSRSRRCGEILVRRRRDRRDRVDRERVLRTSGSAPPSTLVAGRLGVGDVDDRRVGVAGGDRGERRLHVGAAGDLRRVDGDAGAREDLVGVLAARHRRAAQRDDARGSRGRRASSRSSGCPASTTIVEQVRREHRRLRRRPARRSTSFCMLAPSADANTSAGAPPGSGSPACPTSRS